MNRRRHDGLEKAAGNTVLGLAAATIAVVAYGFLVIPSQRAEARRAVTRLGYEVVEIHADAFAFCARNRQGFRWSATRAQGTACVGGFMPAAV